MSRHHNLGNDRRTKIRAKLLVAQGGHCCYCEIRFETSNLWGDRYPTLEHIEDRAGGGANAQHNLALACFCCNQRAGREKWSTEFKRAKIRAANVIAIADLEVEPMELPPLYLAQVRRSA